MCPDFTSQLYATLCLDFYSMLPFTASFGVFTFRYSITTQFWFLVSLTVHGYKSSSLQSFFAGELVAELGAVLSAEFGDEF